MNTNMTDNFVARRTSIIQQAQLLNSHALKRKITFKLSSRKGSPRSPR